MTLGHLSCSILSPTNLGLILRKIKEFPTKGQMSPSKPPTASNTVVNALAEVSCTDNFVPIRATFYLRGFRDDYNSDTSACSEGLGLFDADFIPKSTRSDFEIRDTCFSDCSDSSSTLTFDFTEPLIVRAVVSDLVVPYFVLCFCVKKVRTGIARYMNSPVYKQLRNKSVVPKKVEN